MCQNIYLGSALVEKYLGRSLGCSAVSQDQAFFVPDLYAVLFKHLFQAEIVSVEALEPTVSPNDSIHRPNGLGFGRKLVQILHDLGLVGHGHVQPCPAAVSYEVLQFLRLLIEQNIFVLMSRLFRDHLVKDRAQAVSQSPAQKSEGHGLLITAYLHDLFHDLLLVGLES